MSNLNDPLGIIQQHRTTTENKFSEHSRSTATSEKGIFRVFTQGQSPRRILALRFVLFVSIFLPSKPFNRATETSGDNRLTRRIFGTRAIILHSMNLLSRISFLFFALMIMIEK